MKLDAKALSIVGKENVQVIGGEMCLNATGTHRLADAVIAGQIPGNIAAAQKLKEQVSATVQATKRLN